MITSSVAGISYAFPGASLTVGELAEAGLIQSEARLLEGFGFGRVHIATVESPYQLALEAADRLLRETEVDTDRIGLLVYGGTPGSAAFAPASSSPSLANWMETTDRFRFPATRLQYDLGLSAASVIGVDQLACVGMFGAVRVARAICALEGIDFALCVGSEFYPMEAGREAIFNCTSDAACAVLVQRGGDRQRILAMQHVTKGYYWDAASLPDEVVASYFPTATHVIQRTLDEAGWAASEVDWVIPHNVSLRSWEILLSLTGMDRARLWSRNVPRDGHTLAGDNFINLKDALGSGGIRSGDRLLLFSYGYGAHWTAMAVEA